MVLFTSLSSQRWPRTIRASGGERQNLPNAPFSRQIEFESYRDRTPPSLHGQVHRRRKLNVYRPHYSLPPDNQSRTLFVAFKPMRSLNKGDVLPRKEDVRCGPKPIPRPSYS
jgi:hypothetical protein